MTTASETLYDALAPIYDAWQASDGMTPFALLAHARLEPVLARWRLPATGATGAAAPTAAGGDAVPLVVARGGGTRIASFLDLGCGTGELLLALGRSHPDWRLAGLDASAGMLAEAARKPGAAGVTWARARMDGALPVAAGSFDAAGAFYDAFNHLPDAGALAAALAAAADALRPGGLLAFDLTNALGFERWWHGDNRWAGAGWSVGIQTRYDHDARTGLALVDVARGPAQASFTLRERLFLDAEIEAALATAGLAVDKTEPWSPFALDAPGKTLWLTHKTT